MSDITYSVQIVGDVPPFKWKAQYVKDGMMKPLTPADCSGEESTREDCYRAAMEKATELEDARRYGATILTETLFVVPETVPQAPSLFRVEESLPEAYDTPCGGLCARYGQEGCHSSRCIVGGE